MAIAFDADLGQAADDTGATSKTLTTAAAAAANTLIIISVTWWSSPLASLTSLTVGGQAATPIGSPQLNGSDQVQLYAFFATAGLPSGSSIVANFSGTTAGHALCACSFTGLTGINAVASTGQNGASGTAWSTPSVTTTAEAIIFGASKAMSGTPSNTPNVGTEVHDIAIGTARGFCDEYLIETTPGSYSLSGTWTTAAATDEFIAAFQAPVTHPNRNYIWEP